MSNSTQEDGIDIPAFQAAQIGNFLIVSVIALYCFEWFVTVVQEVEHIWVKNWTLSTWIFAVNRYASLMYVVATTLPAPTFDSCRSVTQAMGALSLVLFVAAALFSGLRVFALCNRNVWLFLVVFALNMVPFATNMFHFIMDTIEPTDSGCTSLLNTTEKVELGLSLSTRGCVILADVIVLVVTWIKTFGTVREASRLKIKVPLSEIMIRDGTLFFIILLGVNILVLVANDLPSDTVSTLPIVSGSFLQSITPIIISRFMLNLRQTNRPSGNQGHTAAQRSTIRFNLDILVGSMGGSLQFGVEDDELGGGSEDERSGVERGEVDAFPTEDSDHDTEDVAQIQEIPVA